MKIALVTHRFVRGDGQGRVNYELARAALAAGHSVAMVACEVDPQLAAQAGARTVRIARARVPSALLQNQLFAWRTSLWLWRHRGEYDLVHVNGFVTWARADINTSHFVHAAWLRSPHHTWRVRRDLYGLYQLLYSVLGCWLEAWSYRHARRVVAVSEQVRQELLASGIPAQRLQVIHNGVDTAEFVPGPGRQASAGRACRMLFVGDIKTPRKNLDTLLRALVHVEGAVLEVAGGVEGSPYPRMAADLGLEQRVSFLGFRRDVAQLMQAADVFVFPSRYEACSLVLLEAAACGLPVVAARRTGGTEILNPQCAVLLADADDAQELAAALNALAADPQRLERMGREARSVAVRNSWQVMAAHYLGLYRELSGRPGSEAAAVRSGHATS
jgi:glycosyltransferase involved in cell wall biosynthesis